jgi:calcium-dependent protein kinase
LNSKFGSVYYVAPEVLVGNYDEKCDIWSTGVIMFILLSGTAPFNGRNDEMILKNVMKGEFSIDDKEWEGISDQAKDLVQKMLRYTADDRISAKDALSHDWFKNFGHETNENGNADPHAESIKAISKKRVLRNLKNFRSESKLQEAIYFFIMTHLSTKTEKDNLLNTFLDLDDDCDGLITKDDLKKAYDDMGRGTFITPKKTRLQGGRNNCRTNNAISRYQRQWLY